MSSWQCADSLRYRLHACDSLRSNEDMHFLTWAQLATAARYIGRSCCPRKNLRKLQRHTGFWTFCHAVYGESNQTCRFWGVKLLDRTQIYQIWQDTAVASKRCNSRLLQTVLWQWWSVHLAFKGRTPAVKSSKLCQSTWLIDHGWPLACCITVSNYLPICL